MNWKEIPVYVVDFEGSTHTGIVEYGVATLLGAEIIDTRTRLCCPENEIRECDVFFHGIRHELAAKEAPFSDEWDYFCGLRKRGPLAAHHASVENNFIKRVWPYPPNCPDFLNPGDEVACWGDWVDTCALYKKIYPGLEGYKLSHLIKQFQLHEVLNGLAKQHCPGGRQVYHCALYDALASALLLKRLDALEGFENMTLEWLLRMSNTKGDSAMQMNLGL